MLFRSIRRQVLYVPPSMAAADLLIKMQATRIHMALIVDEYGGTDGLVTIEDLVEQIVGDIEDEHDVPVPKLKLGRRRVLNARANAVRPSGVNAVLRNRPGS